MMTIGHENKLDFHSNPLNLCSLENVVCLSDQVEMKYA